MAILDHAEGVALGQVGVRQAQGDAALGQEEVDEIGIAGVLVADPLDGDEPAPGVLALLDGEEYLGHPTVGDPGQQQVFAEALGERLTRFDAQTPTVILPGTAQ